MKILDTGEVLGAWRAVGRKGRWIYPIVAGRAGRERKAATEERCL